MTVSATSPIPASNSIDINGVSDYQANGVRAMLMAFNANYMALQTYDINMLSLSSSLAKQQNNLQIDIINKMNGPDGPIAKLSSNTSGNVQANAATYSAQFQVMNTQYGQVSSQYQGLTQSVNQGASDVTQTMQTNLSMMGTNGILALLQALARML